MARLAAKVDATGLTCRSPQCALLRAPIVLTIGADFHRAMVATAPGEKLLIGRRPMRNWTQLQFVSLFHSELRLIIDVMICSLQSPTS